MPETRQALADLSSADIADLLNQVLAQDLANLIIHKTEGQGREGN